MRFFSRQYREKDNVGTLTITVVQDDGTFLESTTVSASLSTS